MPKSTLPTYRILTPYTHHLLYAQQTAEIIAKAKPHIDASASVPQSPQEIREQILERRKTHPLGIAGALFEAKEAHLALKLAGQALSNLIQQALNELDEGQKALIVSHDGTMVATERILTDVDFDTPLIQTYDELEGFVVNENLQLQKLEP